MKNIFIILAVILSVILIHSYEDKPAQSAISTKAVTAITQTTSPSSGNKTNKGGSAIINSGVCRSTSISPTHSMFSPNLFFIT